VAVGVLGKQVRYTAGERAVTRRVVSLKALQEMVHYKDAVLVVAVR